MPISVTGNSTEWRTAAVRRGMPAAGKRRVFIAMGGFTLLELLVTLAIVGLLSGAAVLSIPDRSPARRLQATAITVLDTLLQASHEARAYGQPVRVGIKADRMHFERYSPDGWRDLSLDDAHHDGVIRLLHTRLHLRSGAHQDSAGGELWLLPDGSHTPFTMTLQLGQAKRRIDGPGVGPMRLHTGQASE